jgi:hypothetical protein
MPVPQQDLIHWTHYGTRNLSHARDWDDSASGIAAHYGTRSVSDTTWEVYMAGDRLAQFGHPEPARTVRLHPPAGRKIGAILPNARGSALAWLLEALPPPQSPLRALLHRCIPQTPATEQPRFEVWVSHPDGSAMREVGYLPIKVAGTPGWPGPLDDTVEGPRFIDWIPDGNGISYVYKDALWTLPVD